MPGPEVLNDLRRKSCWSKGLRLSCVILIAWVVLLFTTFRYVGEQQWWVWPWLYMPIAFWAWPLGILAPLALFFDRRMFWVMALLVAWLILGVGGWRMERPATATGEKTLTLVTYNSGEHNDTSVNDFLRTHQPDILLLQSERRERPPLHDLKVIFPEGIHQRMDSTFLIQSRYPILNHQLIHLAGWMYPVAVRYQIQMDDRVVTIYSVHLPTPRRDYDIAKGNFYSNLPFKQRMGIVRESIARRHEMIESLFTMFQAEEGPLLIAGDFNMASWGWLHHRFTRHWTDVHGTTGGGFGFTFPGYDPYMPTPIGPWVRLDYVFCNEQWRPLKSEVEKDRASQHRALAVTLEVKP